MAARVTVKFDKGRVSRALKKLSKLAPEEGKRAIAESALAVTTAARRRAPVDQGRLRNNIAPRFFDNGLVAEVGSRVGYSAFIEFGTGTRNVVPPAARQAGFRPGTGTPHFPPPAALEQWARRHGMDESAAYAVAFAIFKRGGLEPRPFMFPSLEEEVPKLFRRIKAAIKRAIDGARQ